MKKFSLFLSFLVCATITFAQNEGISINATGASPHPSAMLDISGASKGVLINRMTQEERDAIVNPATGLQVFNTTTNCLNMWNGNTWKRSCFDCDFNSPTAANNGPICAGSTLSLSATSIGLEGATYQWSGPNGFTSDLQNPTIEDATAGASGSYSVIATLNGCSSQPQTTVATVNENPDAPSASNSGPACVGTILNLLAETVPGALYSWTGPNGYSASTQNPIITSSQLSHAGAYNVSVSVNGCASSSGLTDVEINTIPSTPGSISGTATVCPNSSGHVYSISPANDADSYNWTIPSLGSITSDSGNSITVTFGPYPTGSITVSATNECGTTTTSSLSTFTETICSPMVFNNSGTGRTGSPQTFTVPQGITSIVIDAYGAKGGSTGARSGGNGARITGTFSVTPGQVLSVAVGQMGSSGSGSDNGSGGGGGASYVTYGGSYLLIAGGGGGAGSGSSASDGQSGQAGQNGTAGGGTAGTSGNAGDGGNSPGCCGCSAGAGWYQASGAYNGWSTGASSLMNGGTGALHQNGTGGDGGYGGGGSGAYGGGGGGGYSGGGGDCGSSSYMGGGGGGSINTGSNQSNETGTGSGHGVVSISW